MVSTPAGFRNNAFPQPEPRLQSSEFPAAGVPQGGPFERIGCWFLYCYIFLALSRIVDVTTGGLRVAGVLYVGLTLAALLSGRLFNIFKTRLGWTMVLLFFWCSLSVPFSTWRGASVLQYQEVIKAFFLGVAIMAIPTAPKDVMRLQRTVALGIATAALLSWHYGRLDYGRLVMDISTYADPNQFAMTLLMAVPLLAVMAARAKTLPARLLWAGCVVPVMIAFMRTGSRGALIGLAAVFIVAFLMVSAKQKMLLVVASFVLGAVGLAVMPSYVRARFLTFFSATEVVSTENLTEEEARQLVGSDVGSSQARWSLLMDSIAMTWHHPLLGVGIGQFKEQNWQQKLKEGNRFANQSSVETHNVYTQFSSEAGIPAMIFCIMLLVQAFLLCGKIQRISPELAASAGGMRLVLVALAVCGFFLAVAYSQLFYIMGGIVARLYLTAVETRRPAPSAFNLAPAQGPRSGWGMQPAPVAAGLPSGLPAAGKLATWQNRDGSSRNRP